MTPEELAECMWEVRRAELGAVFAWAPGLPWAELPADVGLRDEYRRWAGLALAAMGDGS